MLLAHAPIAYIANEVIQRRKISKLKTAEHIIIAILSLLFGIFPDFDLFLMITKNLPASLHHDTLTHYPIFYISIWLLLRVTLKQISKIFNKKTSNIINYDILEVLINTFLIGTISHLIADMFASDISLLYPISNHKFGVAKHIFKTNLFAGYMLSPIFISELTFISLFLSMLYKKFFQMNIHIKRFLHCIFILTLILIPVFSYISLNTYNNNDLYDSKYNRNSDIDYDRLEDAYDMDIGNYRIDNIKKADKQKISDSALKIVNSHKWTAQSKLKYRLGGFTSYRLISQTYFDTHLPIEPVLTDHYLKKENLHTYIKDVDYSNILLSYFKDNSMLIELNAEGNHTLPYGRVIFFCDEKEDILNMGITLEGNGIAIVLEEDKVLQMHSYERVKDMYSDRTKSILIQI